MSNAVSELIGRIVKGPSARVEPAAEALQVLAAERPSEPVHVLIGRIIYPYGDPVVSHESAAVAPVADAPREMEPVVAS